MNVYVILEISTGRFIDVYKSEKMAKRVVAALNSRVSVPTEFGPHYEYREEIAI